MPKMIHTVGGLLSVDELGTTLMHEHILQANWSMRMSFKDWFDYDSFIECGRENRDADHSQYWIFLFRKPVDVPALRGQLCKMADERHRRGNTGYSY